MLYRIKLPTAVGLLTKSENETKSDALLGDNMIY